MVSSERDLAERVASGALDRGLTIAAAESVTAGRIATALATAGSASEWFRGSVVAYQTGLKQRMLGVTGESVITAQCASEMAQGALAATGADLAVAVTGVGGPDPEEGRDPGTVFIGVANRSSGVEVFEHAFEGDPSAIVSQATASALQHLGDAVGSAEPATSTGPRAVVGEFGGSADEQSPARLGHDGRILLATSRALAAADTELAAGRALSQLAVDAFAARATAVFLIGEDRELRLLAGTHLPDPHLRTSSRRLGHRALDEERVIVIPDLDAADRLSPVLASALRAGEFEAMTIAPILHRGLQIGMLACYFSRAADFDGPTVALHRAMTDQAGQTLTRLRTEERRRRNAMVDPLTGLANRQLFEERLVASVDSAARSGRLLGVLFIDLDGFKAVNDGLGHPVGDALLAQVGIRLKLAMRDTDAVGRYGGDEFVAACLLDSELAAAFVGERVRTEIARHFRGIPRRYPVTASVGVALYDAGGSPPVTTVELIQAADGAMYRSKSAGRDRVTVVRL